MNAGGPARPVAVLCLVLAACGLAARLAPLAEPQGRLQRQWPSEDSYLMLTVARNLALGRGLSTAAGSEPTNGVQPLATFLWAACFRATAGDRVSSLALVQALSAGLALLAGLAVLRLDALLLAGRPQARTIAALAAALWFASPLIVRHSMNCLETGLHGLGVALVLGQLVRLAERQPLAWSPRSCLGLGLTLGLTFLARNDAVLLAAAVGIARLGAGPGPRLLRRCLELALVAAVMTLVAAPWLGYNLAVFGHLVPTSGQAETLAAPLGPPLSGHAPDAWGQLRALLVDGAEYVPLVLPVPERLETRLLAIVASAMLLAAGLVALARLARAASPPARLGLVAAGVYAAALAACYALFFRAPHFMGRFLYPVSPLLGLGGVLLAAAVVTRPRPRAALALAALALVLGLNLRLWLAGQRQAHWQVVSWVARHVPEDAWVGAIQSGTLGFHHDRTLNLDGKVSAAALGARQEGRLPDYVVGSRADYLADWASLADWIDKPEIARHFELVVADPERNLAVLRRRAPRPAP